MTTGTPFKLVHILSLEYGLLHQMLPQIGHMWKSMLVSSMNKHRCRDQAMNDLYHLVKIQQLLLWGMRGVPVIKANIDLISVPKNCSINNLNFMFEFLSLNLILTLALSILFLLYTNHYSMT